MAESPQLRDVSLHPNVDSIIYPRHITKCPEFKANPHPLIYQYFMKRFEEIEEEQAAALLQGEAEPEAGLEAEEAAVEGVERRL